MEFPNPELADATGLVAIGGDLCGERLVSAYSQGIFPYFSDGDPIYWWSPDPRAIIEFDGFHLSRRLKRTIRAGKFAVTFDLDFAGVIRGCADRPGQGNWITAEMIDAYERLHRLAYAHSVETWHEGKLAGGLYGVSIGGFFAGESMFTRASDASKVALFHLLERLRARGYRLFDCQFLNPHTERLGAIEIPRTEYLARLRDALKREVTFG